MTSISLKQQEAEEVRKMRDANMHEIHEAKVENLSMKIQMAAEVREGTRRAMAIRMMNS